MPISTASNRKNLSSHHVKTAYHDSQRARMSRLCRRVDDQGVRQIVGGDSNVNHLLLQKSDGSYWLVLWLEEPSWDPANVVSIPVAPENIGIQLSGGYTTTTNYQFDSTGNVVLFPQSTVGGLASLTVTDQVSIVRIVPQ